MPGEVPYWIDGEVRIVLEFEAYVKVPNGNIYMLKPFTPGITFSELKVGQKVSCEVTSKLIRVLSARILE